MTALLALVLFAAQVDLTLAPSAQFEPAGNFVTVDLQATAAGPQSVAAIDAILSWDPSELQFVQALPGSYAWFLAGFLPDPDGINLDLLDGQALYTALAPLATPLVVPPGIVVASFKFKVLTGGQVGLLPTLGTFGKTRVLSTTPGVEITGTLGAPVCVGIPGSWTDLGLGMAGTFGLPVLSGSGPQACEALTTLSLVNAKPNAVTWLPIGLSALNLPCKGGVLVPQLDLILIVVTSPTGDVLLQGPWPVGIPPGTSIYYQCWFQDAGGPKGYAASNGLRSTTG